MTLFVGKKDPQIEEEFLHKQVDILTKETQGLLDKALKLQIEISPYLQLLGEICEEQEQTKPLLTHIVLKAKMQRLTFLNKAVRRELFHHVVASTSLDHEIEEATQYLFDWNHRAEGVSVDLSEFRAKFAEVKTLQSTYNPPHKTPFHEEFIKQVYKAYLYFYTNRVIYEVTRAIVEQHSKFLSERSGLDPTKIRLIHDTEEWLMYRLPPRLSMKPPFQQDQLANVFLEMAREKEERLSKL